MKRLPLLVLLIGSFALTANSDSLYHKRYINCDYAYSVQIPAGVVVHGSDPPAPNHGFVIDMRDLNKLERVREDSSPDWLSVDASYQVFAADEGGKSPRTYVRLLYPEARNATWSRTALGGLSASRAQAAHAKRIEEWVTAFRGDIVYTFHLNTSASHYAVDRAVFEKLIQAFKLLPLPKGECSNQGAE